MEQQQHNITTLLLKHFNGSTTATEEAELRQWMGASAANQSFYDELMDNKKLSEKVALFQSFDQEKGWEKLEQQIPGLVQEPQQTGSVFRTWYKYVAAAALVATVLSVWLITGRQADHGAVSAPVSKAAPIQPGGDKATLTLGDGRVVELDTASGTIEEGGARLINFAAGQLSYASSQHATVNSDEPVVYNILKTPPGGQYKVILPDGTQAWLNAASSLRFPTRFNDRHREVSLEGEAFFDVASNAAAPFYVQSGNMQVHVLGTSFNCMAYNDEPAAEITLVTGKVRVAKAGLDAGDAGKNLAPGQQARLTPGADDLIQLRSDVNVDDIIAWKNGLFRFQSADIKTVLRQIARWYNLEIVYEGSVSQERFTGEIPRNSSIDEVSRILRLSNIRCSAQNGKMIVKS